VPSPDQTKQTAADAPVRVLFVAGTGRSGSTLVGNLLGSVPGAVSVGELRYLWERGLRESAPCGCGLPVPQCPFWRDVVARAYPVQQPEPEAIVEVERQLLRVRGLPRLLRAHGDPEQLGAAAIWYAAELASVYRAVSDAAGGAVVVDASKLVGYGYLLGHAEGLDLRVLHLVRDPRGVAHSWQRVRDRDDRGDGDGAMNRESVVKSPVLWDTWNVAAERLWSADPSRYVRVRYEDAVADPVRELGPALAMVGLDPAALPVDHDGTAHLVTSHTVAGNPVRMTSGPVRLCPDEEWVGTMPAARRAFVTAATAPLLPRYGYPLVARAPQDAAGPRTFVEDMTGWRRFEARVARNVVWARSEGLGRVLEEKELDPVRTVPAAIGKWRFRHRPGAVRGAAVPVYVVGLQRSGTNMVVRGLGMVPQVEVHNEDDRRAFDRYKLRSDRVVEDIVARSRHTHVLFKPLCDSHRVDHLLDDLRTPRPGRAVWVYRDVDGRVRSALAKFGDGNRQVLREFAEGTNTTRWHVQRMSASTADLVRSFDYDVMTPASGAALMWLVRNRLYVELGLDQRPDVHLVSYRDFLAAPEHTMRQLCAFLAFPYDPALVAHVTPRPPVLREPLDIDPRIRDLCDDLAAKLDAAGRMREGEG
jgi:hypothetical protein